MLVYKSRKIAYFLSKTSDSRRPNFDLIPARATIRNRHRIILLEYNQHDSPLGYDYPTHSKLAQQRNKRTFKSTA